jgi:probable F420-dependent oxidoreductase
MLDPLETLSYLAANTSRVTLGTCIIDMLFQNPVTLARRIATLDNLSGGRFIAGLGIGWSKDEYEAAGIPFEHRGARTDEYVQALKRIWTDDVVEFKGKFYSIPASKIGPKPIQKPHPPIILGGFSPNTFSRIVKYADGWIPVVGFGPLEQVGQAINGLRENARAVGHNPSEIHVLALSWPTLLDSPQQQKDNRMPMTGDIDQIGGDIAQIKAMGVEHLILGWAFTSLGKDMKKMLEVTAQLARFAR